MQGRKKLVRLLCYSSDGDDLERYVLGKTTTVIDKDELATTPY